PGQLVTSLAGRDRGRHLLIVEVIDDKFVLVADGSLRPIEKPKKKNARHLALHETIVEDMKSRIEKNLPISNEELRAYLERANKLHFGKEV
ncbi:MAG: KOW domain-containing RNA-binding protein, partial [Halanaerobium sp.]|nr:KOW domain-containing RNA-binding protein [Halanaerobium sp.]